MIASNALLTMTLAAIHLASSAAPPKDEDVELNAAVRVGKAIKSSMKNPAAFRLESFLIFPGGATCYEYRSTNSFNA